MLSRFVSSLALAVALAAVAAAPSASADDLGTCADERVKTTLLPLAALAAAEAACSRALAAPANDADRQKAAFYRSLMRFLQVVQRGMEPRPGRGGAPGAYAAPTLAQVRPALADIEAALGIDGPLNAEALALRVTINQTIGRDAEARADLETATRQAGPYDPTPFVQRALEHEKAGDVTSALADLDRALEIDPRAGTALTSRAELRRRLGFLPGARLDYAGAAAAGPPFRRLALQRKSEVELRAGDLRAAYDDLVAAARESGDLPRAEATAASAELLVRAGDLALDKLREPDAAERHYNEAARLAPRNWNAQLGLARVEEGRGNSAKAIAIYRRILANTRSTPRLLERMLASFRLRQLQQPLLRGRVGPFRSSLETGVVASAGSPDGLKRIAFVIGSSDYTELSSLPNAKRDAAVMANALADIGFDVVDMAENLNKADLRSVPAIIAERAAEADVVLVFYAGHGVEAGGVNYLLPIDAAPESDKDLQNDALALADLTAAASKARRGALVIVDACRDDPFVEARTVALSRGAGGRVALGAMPERLHAGLAATPVERPNNVVFHSTQPGQTALDGDGLDSPFVRALLETLAEPGKALDAVVSETTSRVSDKTEGRQVPAAYGAAPGISLLPRAKGR